MINRPSRFLPDLWAGLHIPTLATLILILLAACSVPAADPTPLPPTSIPLADELIFYDWDEDMPQAVLEAFTEEFGVKIKYIVYESQEEAIKNMQEGQVYDVVVMESRFIPKLVSEKLIADLNPNHIPNLKNLSASFRELAYDPGNHYSIPYNWGTTGLVFRSDLVEEPITSWVDLWDPRYSGRVGLWLGQRRKVISLTLKSLGFSANSENPQELAQALDSLIELKPHIIALEEYDLYSSAGLLSTGKVVLSMGYASDVLFGSEQNPTFQYVLPSEGALIWNDTFVVPANSPNQYTAELFLNFLMRPDINASIANENLYASPNEAAYPFINPNILNNPIIYPPNTDLANTELVLPLSLQGQDLYDEIWEQFTAAP